MSEATVFENALPDGWYDDPAKPGMERWWTGTEWTDHVRYTDKARPFALAPVAEEPAAAAEMPTYSFAPSYAPAWPEAVAERPQLSIAPTSAYGMQDPTVSAEPDPASGFNDFYVPMRQIQSGPASSARLVAQRRSTNVVVVWVTVVAVIGIAVGIAVYVLLPR